MKITFLGTGAADWPLERADANAEFRRMSSALIDDILLIDPGPQVLSALADYKKKPDGIKYIVNTHKHSDHYSDTTVNELKALGAELFEFDGEQEQKLGNYTVFSYKANHSTCEEAVHFIISDGEICIFYGLDGAWLMYSEVQAIMKHKPALAVLDATIGRIEGDYRIFEHNNINMVLEMQKTLSPYVGTFCISHMARTLHAPQAELSEDMRKYGIVAAYDGLELCI